MRRPFFSPLLCAAILVTTLIVGIAPGSRAQEAQSPSCTRRTMAVSVLDKTGEPITGLTAADFRAEFRGKPVRILSLTPRARPVHIVVVFDRSGSIGGNAEFWGLGVEVVAHLYAKASRNVLLALFFFGDAVEQRSGFGEDRPAVVNALLHLAHKPKQGKGATLLYDAILAAIQTVPAPQVGDVIYAVTDGVDTASATNRDRIQQQLLRSGLRFFAFPISDPFLHYRTVREPIDLLEDLARSTGGRLFPTHTHPSDRDAEAGKFYRQMETFYEVEIGLSMEPDKERGWKLELVRAKEFKGSQLNYPRFLLPCVGLPSQP